jgi:hypothetical protein
MNKPTVGSDSGSGPPYDLFVVHSKTDQDWVQGYLVPALGLPPGRVLTAEQFRPGASVVEEFDRAVTGSRYTIVVLSPSYLADEWSTFGERLASHAAVSGGRERLVPLLLEPCELPLQVDFRVRLDYTDEARWDNQTARLRELLETQEPPTEELACPYPGMVPFDASQARFFHGRDGEVADLLRRLRHQRFVLVIGPSGSGKSSLVLAGVVSELSRRVPGRWLVRSLRPGAAPMASLTDALGGLPGVDLDAAVELPDRADMERAVASLLQGDRPLSGSSWSWTSWRRSSLRRPRPVARPFLRPFAACRNSTAARWWPRCGLTSIQS